MRCAPLSSTRNSDFLPLAGRTTGAAGFFLARTDKAIDADN